jgi:hypothetical protein
VGLPATPDVVVCGDSGRYHDLTTQAPGFVAEQRLCVPWFVVVVLAPAEGRARVVLGDVAIELDMARIEEIGSPSAGSGEFDVAVTPPVSLEPGDIIELDLRACPACRDVYVRVPLLPVQ